MGTTGLIGRHATTNGMTMWRLQVVSLLPSACMSWSYSCNHALRRLGYFGHHAAAAELFYVASKMHVLVASRWILYLEASPQQSVLRRVSLGQLLT